jgi:formamidopyrimidine-DNA glycosylase
MALGNSIAGLGRVSYGVAMPELPEVETVMSGLKKALLGRRIRAVRLARADLRLPFPPGFEARLAGRRVERFERRAKYILAHLDSGEALLLHLGMSGRFTVMNGAGRALGLGEFYEKGAAGTGDGPHDHVIFEVEGGGRVVYTDPRRFGVMDLIPERELSTHHLLAGIGIEPFDEAFSAEYLADSFRGRKAPLKAALLDQSVIAGLGNIYVCEALHRAGLSPRRKAGSLVKKRGYDPRLGDVVRHIRAVLTEAIAAGGATLRDHAQPDGRRGAFQHRFAVYDRGGQPCLKRGCGGTIRRIVQAGRSTFYCPRCQT